MSYFKEFKEINEEFQDEHPRIYFWVCMFIGIYTVFFVFTAALWLIRYASLVSGHDSKIFGDIGAAFGFWSSGFSGVGLIVVAYTLLLQSKQIKGAEMNASAESFERSFFNALNLLQEARENVSYVSNGFIQGPRAVTCMVDAIKKKNLDSPDNQTIDSCITKGGKLSQQNIEDRVNKFFFVHKQGDTFLHIVHFIEATLEILKSYQTRVEGDDSEEYARMLRSVITHNEITLLALYAISEKGTKLKELTDQFKLFENLDPQIAYAASLDKYFNYIVAESHYHRK